MIEKGDRLKKFQMLNLAAVLLVPRTKYTESDVMDRDGWSGSYLKRV